MLNANLAVLDNLPLYFWFLGTVKIVSPNHIQLIPKGKNAPWLQGASDLNNAVCRTSGTFLIEQSTRNRGHFGFKIRSPLFGTDPCFRFDSDGPTHRNNIPAIPLPKQQITTPHFHCYNPDGILIAYKTPTLNDSKIVEQLRRDICYALSIFAREAMLFGTGTTTLTCAERAVDMFPIEPNEDPLAGISFGK